MKNNKEIKNGRGYEFNVKIWKKRYNKGKKGCEKMSKNIKNMKMGDIIPIKKCKGLDENNKEFIISNAYSYETWGVYLEDDDTTHVYKSKDGKVIAKIEEDWNGEYSLIEYSQRIEKDAFAQMEISKRWRALEEERKEELKKYIDIIDKTKGIDYIRRDKFKKDAYKVFVEENKYGDWFKGNYTFVDCIGELVVEIICDGKPGDYEVKRMR